MTKNPYHIQKGQPTVPLLANIPHSSTNIHPLIRKYFLLNDEELSDELLKVTDWYVDELFSLVSDVGGVAVVYDMSRLVVDPERFEDDEQELCLPGRAVATG